MEIIITLAEDDINTNVIGNNYQIKTNSGISIIFTPEALGELLLDYQLLKEAKNNA